MSVVPKLRFPEYQGVFETKLLEEIADVYQPKTISQSDLTPNGQYVVYGANGVIGKYSDFNHEAEQVAITCRGNTCGRVNFTLPKAWITGNAMVLNMDANAEVFKKFIYYLSTATDWTYQIAGSGQPQITGTIKKHKFKIPSLPEQKKIASFLSSVDKKIDLLRQKKDALDLYKKGLMQKIFSQEICFKRDDGSDFPGWEEVVLGDVAKVTTGTGNREDSQEAGQYIFFDRSTDMRWSGKYEFDQEAIIVAGEGKSFPPRYFVGKFGLHQRAYAIYDFKEASAKFLFYMVYLRQNFFLKMSVGSTMPSLRMNAFTEFPISLPCPPEQQRIASFLSAIDVKIQNTSSQIEQMETFKKGLLQQMFV